MLSKGRSDIVTTGNDLTLRDGYSDETTLRTGANVAARVLTLPVTGADDTLVSNTSTSTLTNKTLTSPTITGGTISGAAVTGMTSVSILDNGSYNLILASSDGAFSANRTLSLDLNNAARTIDLAGNLTLAGNLATSGAYALTLTLTGATDVTLPTTGTLSTLAGTETFTNKTLTSPKLNENVALTTTSTKLNYLTNATGTTGTDTTNVVFSTSPTLVTPVLGVAAATSINKIALTAPATGATLTLADGKTLTCSNTLTFTGTDGSSVAFGAGGSVAYAAGAFPLTAQYALITDINGLINVSTVTQTRLQYLASAGGTTGTTSTNLVFSTSPTLVTPTLGVASATSINKVTLTAPASGATLTIADGKTATISKTMTLTSADDTSTLTLAAGAQTVGGTSSGDIVTLGGTQTLTAKTLTAPIIDQANFTQAASATTPASGKSAVYVNSGDAKLHVVDSSGNDVAVGSGSSGRNYLGDWYDSAKAESVGTSAATSTGNRTVAGNTDPTKWVTSDLTNLTFARSADTTLRQAYNYLINSGDANADFVESPLFTLDGSDLGKPVTVSFDCAGVSASDDYQVCAVRYNSSGTYQEVIRIAGTASATTPYSARIPVGTTSFQGFFVAGSTATDQYAIRFMKHAVNVDLRIDSLYVGPQSVVQGAAVCEIPVPTITWTNGTGLTATTTGLKAYRVGSRMNLRGLISFTGVGSDAGALGMSLTGYSWGTTNQDAGWIRATQYSTVYAYNFFVYKESSTLLNFYTQNLDVAAASTTLKGTTMSASTSGEYNSFYVDIWLDITTWDDGVTMANRAVEEYAYNSATANSDDTTSFAYGAAGVAFGSYTAARSKRIRFTTPILATDRLHLEVYDDTNYMWSSPSETRSGSLVYQNQNGVTYGMYLTGVNATDVDVSFGTYAKPASTTYGGVGSAWSSLASKKWRVRKVSGGASVGYPIASENVIVPHKALATSTTTYTSNSFESGTYTATLTNVSNVSSSTFRNARYIRVGNVVTVFVTFSIATTAAAPTTTQFYLSLPIASAFTAGYDCLGTGTRYKGSGAFDPIYIETDSAGDRAYCYFYSSSTTAADTAMTFSYVVM